MTDEIEANFRQAFFSILARLNNHRSPKDEIQVLDKEVYQAVKKYCNDHPKDFIGMG